LYAFPKGLSELDKALVYISLSCFMAVDDQVEFGEFHSRPGQLAAVKDVDHKFSVKGALWMRKLLLE
jgi:hypothetical protein